MRLSRKELQVLEEEQTYWKELESLIGWRLYGWTRKDSASFITISQWGTEILVNLTGTQRDDIVNAIKGLPRVDRVGAPDAQRYNSL